MRKTKYYFPFCKYLYLYIYQLSLDSLLLRGRNNRMRCLRITNAEVHNMTKTVLSGTTMLPLYL